MRLIITEKNNSAKKIAEILGRGEAVADASYKTPYYRWVDSDGNEQVTVGLKGHVLNPAFPEGYSNWQETDPKTLIDAELVKEATDKNVVKAVRKLAKEAASVVIATDFDREGELIGLEALGEALEANPELVDGAPAGDAAAVEALEAVRPPVKRARYSALTKEEIERAFGELDELSYPLADAAQVRQEIDLIWGATLTRAVSLATRRFGSNFLSVGRVQSPTLGLIVERELERRAHVSKPYWEVFAKFAHPDGSFEAHHKVDKFWEKPEAEAALAATDSPGEVISLSKRKNTRKPPAPYNTTAFTTDASSRLGITPSQAMRIAEDLYMDGFISYPRTDNTVYPKSLNTRELVASLVRIPEFSAAKDLLDGRLEATRGKKETTDHPPIYPTQAVYPNALEGSHRRVYELVVRRFLATFGKPMITESARADIRAGTEDYYVRGSIVVDPGYAAIYTYARSADNELPALEEGQKLELEGAPWMVDKETQPPARLSQGKLIEMMEELGLGTKATRPDIIQKLYSRGYVYGNPPEPSETGIAMYKAFREHVLRMATPEMTAELERDMDQIAAGESTKDEVIKISRDMLHQTYDDLHGRREELAKTIWAGMDEDKYIGICEVCEKLGRTNSDGEPNRLRIIDLKGGKRFWGCEGYDRDDPEGPDSCTNSGPLPGRGYELWRLEPRCSVCGVRPRLTVKGFRGRPWKLCLNDDCPTMVEMREKREERRKAKEEAERRKAEAGEDGEDSGAGQKAKAKGKPKGGRARKKPPATTTRTKRAKRGRAPAASRSRGG
jgi:DNA topoisomerase I